MKLTCAFAWLTAMLSIGHTVVAQDKPKNLIMVIPDGCDEAVLSIARWFKDEPLFLDTVDQGRMLSYMSNSIIADSAPAGTSLATGEFSTNRFISVGPDEESMITSMVTDPDHKPWPAFHPIPTIVEAARRKGMATGIVATSTVTHATPGAFGSHVDNRSNEPQMAMQMVHQNIDLIMGGGRTNLLPREECFPFFSRLQGRSIRNCRVDGPCDICEGSCKSDDDCVEGLICHFRGERTEPGSIESLVPGCIGESTSRTNWCVDPTARVPTSPFGRRDDCLNMEDVLLERGYDLCYTKTEMDALSGDNPVWCSFAERAMEAEINRATFEVDQPSFAEMTKKAIELLSQSEKGAENGFFLMVEASQVDWAGHANDPIWMITDFIQYDEAFKVAAEFAMEDGETAVIGTPDHNTGGMKLGNYRPVYTSMAVEELVEPLKKMTLTGEGVLRMTGKPFDEITATDLQQVVSEYWGIDLPDDLADEIIGFSEKYSDVYRSSPVAVIPLTYALGKIVSEYYTVIGWTSFGHNGDNLPIWVHGVEPPRDLIDIADFGKWGKDLIDAPDMSDLFIDVDTTGLSYEINTENKSDGYAIIEGYKFPLNTDYFLTSEGPVLFEGVSYYAGSIEKLFVSADAIEKLENQILEGQPPGVFSSLIYPDVDADYSTFAPDSVSGEKIAD